MSSDNYNKFKLWLDANVIFKLKIYRLKIKRFIKNYKWILLTILLTILLSALMRLLLNMTIK